MDKEWKVDPKSGIRYKDPDDSNQKVFYVMYITQIISKGYAPMISWYTWKVIGPFIYTEALKRRKQTKGIITKDPNPPDDSRWTPCWYNASDYLNDERYPIGSSLRHDYIHYHL